MEQQKIMMDQIRWLAIGFLVAEYAFAISVMLAGLTHV